ncbi:DUF7144 family membrane protein [Nocardioides alcanivorans]|uniref:DUF7144 family membrane protein n=1 Tax=Nocardioides alcanivorans TaxID=2897352 RepID=UPI001F3B9B87|nr:hypothetical protein [Nocardioides alcanivorans]
MSQQRTGGPAGPAMPDYTRNQTGWVGWIVFAGMLLVLLGVFHAVQGLVALFRDEVFLVGQNGLVVNADYTVWGWVHLLGGILAVLVGVGVLAGRLWAQMVAVCLAFVSAIVNLGFLPAFPIWSVLMITLDVLVMWALVVHGDELRPDEDAYPQQ